MAHRKTVDLRWICSWNCGFEDYDIDKVARHETEVHCNRCHRCQGDCCDCDEAPTNP